MVAPRGAWNENVAAFPTLTDRYLARLIVVPLVATLLLAAMLLLLEKMLRLFDFVAAEGGPASIVWRMLANTVPEYMSLGVPLGLLLGVLLAFRKLSLQSELDVYRAVGVGYGRLLRVPYLFAVVLLLVNVAIVGWVQPVSRYSYEELRFDLRSGALGASIKVGEFTRLGSRITLRVEESRGKGEQLSGVFVMAEDKQGRSIAVTAAEGRFLASATDPEAIIFRLNNGRLVHDAPAYQVPRVLSFERYDLPIDLPAAEAFRGRGDKNIERTIPELWQLAYGGAAPPDKARSAEANLHFRLVELAMMLLLPLLAVALAVPPKRSASSLGIFLSIVIVVTYHKLSEYAESAAARGSVDPVLALWLPFLIFAALIGWMYRNLALVPGGQPIGALERGAAKAGAAVRRLFGVARRRRPELGQAAVA